MYWFLDRGAILEPVLQSCWVESIKASVSCSSILMEAWTVQYVAAMMDLFGQATQRLCGKLDEAVANGEDMEMESLFSRLTLDIIGKAVFNYEFDSLSNDTGIVEVSLCSIDIILWSIYSSVPGMDKLDVSFSPLTICCNFLCIDKENEVEREHRRQCCVYILDSKCSSGWLGRQFT